MRCKPIEYVCRYCLATEKIGEADDDGDRQCVEQNDEKTVHECLESACCRRRRTFHEERDGHRYHRENARCQKHSKSPEYGLENESPDGVSCLLLFFGSGYCRCNCNCLWFFQLDFEVPVFRGAAVVVFAA